jgi:hypothetical protein
MKKPGRLLVIAVSIPLLAGCFGVLPSPIPATPVEREALQIRGVVLNDVRNNERIEFSEILEVLWADDALSIIGKLADDGEGDYVTRLYPLSTLSAVLVRQVAAGKTSGIMGGLIIGTIAFLSVLVTGSKPFGG